MAQPKVAVRGFLFAAVLFVVVAFLPVVRGGSLNATFLALSVVFFVLGIAVAKKNRGTESSSSR
jgi:succinate-acetate transporter protein